MSNSNPSVCNIDDFIEKKAVEKLQEIKINVNKTHDLIANKFSQTADQIKSTVNDTVHTLQNTKNNIINKINQKYKETSINQFANDRPDMALLAVVTIFVTIMVCLIFIWPHLSITQKPIFTQEQYLQAQELSENDFTLNELTKIKNEANALKQYSDFFKSNPYSRENQGLDELNKGVIFLPIISFIIIYIVPPFVILYIVWFIIKYWRYVIDAIWGWYLMIYRYSTTLIECKLAEKWYIRTITGWNECSPSFSDYFNAWRRKYIDIPIYYEKLRYIQQYYDAKKKYYTIPKKYYIDLPKERYAIKTQFYRKVYIGRALDVFLKKMLDWYHVYYELPRDQLYLYLLRNNQNLAAVWAKMKQTQKQVRGLPYESTTPSGSKCTCPASQTPVKMISDLVQSNINVVKDDVNTAKNKVKDLYDQINNIREKQKQLVCNAADKVIQNKSSALTYILSFVILTILFIIIYSQIYGTPKWLAQFTSPTWKFSTNYFTLKPELISVYPNYIIYIILSIFVTIAASILYKLKFK